MAQSAYPPTATLQSRMSDGSAPPLQEFCAAEPAGPDDLLRGRFGPYVLLDEIAKGGMGVVYRARREGSPQIVALKMIRTDKAVAEDEIGRFRLEARTAGSLQHPNIVPILDVGQCGGRQFFTMRLAAGGSLARRTRQFGRSPRIAVGLIEKVARAIHCAHAHGILHRDLKPSNILLDDQDEPLVCDFGLAKFAGEQAVISQSAPVGTPPYMAPEQVQWPSDRVGPRTDVWALGVILYELLTGERPFKGESYAELIYRILFTEPRPLHEVRPDVPPSLGRIVLGCLEKRPALRYASAEAFADELSRWLKGEETARLDGRSLAAGVRRFARGRPFAAAIISLAAIGVPAVLPVLTLRGGEHPAMHRAAEELSEGRPVTLIGETGGAPGWAEWAIGKAEGAIAVGSDNTCLLQCWDFGLLELMPQIRTPGFRFEAELRHIAGDRLGLAGLYLAHSRKVTADGVFHSLLTLTFNDRAGTAVKANRQGRAILGLRVVSEASGPKGFSYCIDSDASCPFSVAFPHEHQAGWRRIALEVTTQTVRAFFDGVLIGEWTSDDMAKRIAGMSSEIPPGARPAVLRSGGMGVCVSQGAANVRNVKVMPLNP